MRLAIRANRKSLRALAVCAAAAAFFQSGVAADAGGDRRVEYRDLIAARSVDEFDISRDGRLIAYSEGGELFVEEHRSGTSAKVDVGPGVSPKWAPDGKRLAFFSTGRNPQLQIYDVARRARRWLTTFDGGIKFDYMAAFLSGGRPDLGRALEWSPDGEYIVFSAIPERSSLRRPPTVQRKTVNESAGPLIFNRSTPMRETLAGLFSHAYVWLDETGRAEPPSELFLIASGSKRGSLRQLTHEGGCYQPSWSPDGSRIACISTRNRRIDGDLATTTIIVLNARTARPVAVTGDDHFKSSPRWLHGRNQLVYFDNGSRGGMYGVATLRTWDIRSGVERALCPGFGIRIRDFGITDDDRILFLYQYGQRTSMGSVTLGARGIHIVRTENPNRAPTTLVVRGSKIAWAMVSSTNPGTIEVFSGSDPVQVIDLNPQVHRLALGRRMLVQWKNTKGDMLEGSVVLPPGIKRGIKYPMIVDAYPLSRSVGGMEPLYGNQAWASLGYLVFTPAPRAPHVWQNDWTTRQFTSAARGKDGWSVTQDDLMSGVREVIRSGLADEHRICIYGHSNGGTVAINVIARTGIFRCAIAVAPVALDWLNNATLMTETAAEWRMTYGGKSVYDDTEGYLKLSVLFHAKTITTPVLIAIGDGDDAHTVLDSIKMYNALRYEGRDVTLLRYPQEGHVFAGVGMADLYRRELSFFRAHLK